MSKYTPEPIGKEADESKEEMLREWRDRKKKVRRDAYDEADLWHDDRTEGR